MKALIVDDESSARSRLTRQLRSCPQIEIVGEAENGLTALQAIVESKPDVVFLDIQMPGMNGFEVLRALPVDAPRPYIVFVTGFDEHALAAFEADAVAYLLKPVQQEKLERVVARVHTFCLGNSPAEERASIDKVACTLSPPMRQVVARQRNRFLLLPPAGIVFFKVEDGIVRAFTANDSYWVNFQLSDLEAALSGDLFFRASRSELLNLYQIKEVRPFLKSTFLVVMNDAAKTEIHVGERRAKELRERIPGL